MVIYNPKDWWRLIFAFHKSDTFRMMLPGMIGVSIFTAGVAYLENEVLHVTFKNTTAIHALVGFVLSMMLVFRSNSAYERWWEGRKAWGSFVNNSRNFALKLSVLPISNDQKSLFKDLINNYLYAAKEHLRGNNPIDRMIHNQKYGVEWYQGVQHLPNRIMKAVYAEVHLLYKNGTISGEELLNINDELRSFTDNIGTCERIKKTPIPYSYSLFFKKIIFIYVFTMPIGFVREFGYWAMPIVSLVFYVFGSIELLAEEIEDPFGLDPNDLPTDQIYETIVSNIDEIMQ